MSGWPASWDQLDGWPAAWDQEIRGSGAQNWETGEPGVWDVEAWMLAHPEHFSGSPGASAVQERETGEPTKKRSLTHKAPQ